MQLLAKALIQSAMGRLPEQISRPIYFRMQRHFGNLRRGRTNPTSRLLFGLEFCRQIRGQGRTPRGATFMEIGTGWRLNMPIAFWLCGARRTLTFDLNPYLKFSLIKEDLEYLRQHQRTLLSQLRDKYGDLLDESRWNQLIEHRPTTLDAFCAMCGIIYQSPADARRTGCRTGSVDFHVSCNVFEHIPLDDLRAILVEANRVTKPSGLLLHRVDHTDHFSHADSRLSPIHFLRFTDAQWQRYAGSRYSYVNRLREDDYDRLFRECAQRIEATHSESDPIVEKSIRQGLAIDARFRDKSPQTLSHLTSLFVASPQSANRAVAKAA